MLFLYVQSLSCVRHIIFQLCMFKWTILGILGVTVYFKKKCKIIIWLIIYHPFLYINIKLLHFITKKLLFHKWCICTCVCLYAADVCVRTFALTHERTMEPDFVRIQMRVFNYDNIILYKVKAIVMIPFQIDANIINCAYLLPCNQVYLSRNLNYCCRAHSTSQSVKIL